MVTSTKHSDYSRTLHEKKISENKPLVRGEVFLTAVSIWRFLAFSAGLSTASEGSRSLFRKQGHAVMSLAWLTFQNSLCTAAAWPLSLSVCPKRLEMPHGQMCAALGVSKK